MARVIVIGGANVDIKGRSNGPVIARTSNPGQVTVAAGGVAANHIASWNGSTWSPLGSGMNAQVLALRSATGELTHRQHRGNRQGRIQHRRGVAQFIGDGLVAHR